MIASSHIAGTYAPPDGNLGDAACRELRLVVEDSAEVISIGKDFVLQGQEGAARVDEIDAWQAILEGDLLRTQVLLYGQRVVGAALYGRVVGDDHAADAANGSDSADEPRGRQRHVVDAIRGELADLEPRRVGVEQLRDARAYRQLVALEMPRAGLLRAAGFDLVERAAQLLRERTIGSRVTAKLRSARIDLRLELGH
jgi:hypothetical protein